MIVATLNLDCYVNQLLLVAKQVSVSNRRLRLVRDNGNDGRKLTGADLPNMKVSNERVAVTLDCTPNLFR